MSRNTSRRRFLTQTALAGLTLAELSGSGGQRTHAADQPGGQAKSTGTQVELAGGVSLSRPQLAESQLAFRLGLARQRTASYPCDRMDFIMLDLERPRRIQPACALVDWGLDRQAARISQLCRGPRWPAGWPAT